MISKALYTPSHVLCPVSPFRSVTSPHWRHRILSKQIFEIESEHKLFYWLSPSTRLSAPQLHMTCTLTMTSDLSAGEEERENTLPVRNQCILMKLLSPLLFTSRCRWIIARPAVLFGGAERLLHLADSHSHTKQGVLIKKWAAGSTPTRTNTPDSCARRPRGHLWRLSRSDGWVILRIAAWNHDTHTQLTCTCKGLCGLYGCWAQCLPVVTK